jgi:hypothetical protein
LKDIKDILIIGLIILVVTLSCLPLFRNIHNINTHFDWLQMLSYYRTDREAVLEYHQLPLRTHYFGGGYPLIANPQDGFLNPFFIPVLIFGEVIGLKINVFLAHLIAALGMYYLTRYVLNYNYLGALFSSIVFSLGGHIHRLLIRGQDYVSTFYCFFIPLALALFLKSKDNKKYLFYTVFILAIIVTQAGLYFVPTLLFIFLFSCLEAFKLKDKRFILDVCYIKNFFIIILFVFLLGAVKILPMLELLRQNPRSMDGYNPFWGPLMPGIYQAFFRHQSNFPFPGQHWNYFYLGFLPIILFFLSFLIYWQKTKRYFVLLIIFLLLSFGAHTRLDLFKLLWQLPVFHSIEAPTRYFVPFVIFIIAFTSGQLFLIREKIKPKFITLIFILLTIFTTVDLFLTNGTNKDSFPLPVPKYTKQTPFFPVKNSGPGDKVSPSIPKRMFLLRSWEWTMPTQYELMLQNIGKINWYGNIHLGEYAIPKYYIDWDKTESPVPENYTWHLNPDYKGEIYFLNSQINKAELKYFSSNKIIAKVSLVEPDTLIINQSYDKYWKAGSSKPISHKGLLALPLDKKGNYKVNFSYMPISFYLGLIISLATFIYIIHSCKNV